MSDKKDNRWFAGFDRWLDKQAQKRIDRYIDRYAKKEDGTTDEALARRIGWEVGRRAETGKQLDGERSITVAIEVGLGAVDERIGFFE